MGSCILRPAAEQSLHVPAELVALETPPNPIVNSNTQSRSDSHLEPRRRRRCSTSDRSAQRGHIYSALIGRHVAPAGPPWFSSSRAEELLSFAGFVFLCSPSSPPLLSRSLLILLNNDDYYHHCCFEVQPVELRWCAVPQEPGWCLRGRFILRTSA